MKRRNFLKTLGIGCLGCCLKPLEACAVTTRHYSKNSLLKKYDSRAQRRRELYGTIFEAAELDAILTQMRASYESIMPDMPYIGEVNFHLQWFIPNSEKLADYLVAEKYGITAAQFSRLNLERDEQDLYDKYSESELIQIGSMQFGPMAEMQMRMRAWRSQLCVYPEDYIFTFVKGDGQDFDWGLDYTQCANVELYSKYDELELLYHMVCNADYVAGRAMHTGYHRTTELSTSGKKCDLRWKQGVESTVPE